jgi:HAD superfamily hydrolase (TIGR01509 family)
VPDLVAVIGAVVIEAIVFDLDGVLLDSEQLWDRARREVVVRAGGQWADDATGAMQGMSSVEWAAYMRDGLGVALEPPEIIDRVVAGLLDLYAEGLPLLPGAVDVLERLGRRWPLGLASSSNRVVIDRVLAQAGLDRQFAVTVSSEEVARGKPAPDVYLEAARRLGRAPVACAAVEDSANGIRAATAAGLAVVAVPNPDYPPPPDVLGSAAVVLDHLGQLTVEVVEGLSGAPPARIDERLDEVEAESFPASDSHSDWAGPPG